MMVSSLRPTSSSGSQPSSPAAAAFTATIRFSSSAATVGVLLSRTWTGSKGTVSSGPGAGSRGMTVQAVG